MQIVITKFLFTQNLEGRQQFQIAKLFDLEAMLNNNGLGAFVQQLGQTKLRQFGQYLRDFFDKIAVASREELPFIMHDDAPALLTGLISAMDAYDQAFTQQGSPYANDVRMVRQQLPPLISNIRRLFAPLVDGKQREGASLYDAQTSQFSDMMTSGVTQLPAPMIPNVKHAVGDYFSDIFRGFMWALDMQLTNLPTDDTELRQAVARAEAYLAQSFYTMYRILKS